MTSPDSLPPSNRDVSKPDRPLLLRLYSSPHLVEVVRLFGDREVSESAAHDELKPLIAKFGKPRIQAATDEVLIGRDENGTTWFRLTDEVRRLSAPLLGAQPATSVVSREGTAVTEPSPTTSSSADVSLESAPPFQEQPISSSVSTSVDHPGNPNSRPLPIVEREPDGFSNFETFLVDYWLSCDPDVCDSLIDAACEDLEHSPKVIDEGWSVQDAAVHYVAESLRDLIDQEAFSRTNADPDVTRQTLERIDLRQLAKLLLEG